MGEAISTSTFAPEDYEAFRAQLARDVSALSTLMQRPGFGEGPTTIGAEVEMSLVDDQMRPARVNRELISALADDAGLDGLAPELDRFGIELETPPVMLARAGFSELQRSIQARLDCIAREGERLGCRPVLIGTLPTVGLDELAPTLALTPEPRYAALAAGLSRQRADDVIDIAGVERLRAEVRGIAAEGILSALQVHLRVAPAGYVATLNAAHVASAPVLGASANSPFAFGRSLWAETRVPLFRQVVDGAGRLPGLPSRVALGHGWLRRSPLELFVEDARMHPPLLPVRFDATDDGTIGGDLPALRLHSGTVWRWNRPVFDPRDGGHVRMELRCLPSGPTVADMLANAAFLVGAALALAEEWDLPAAMPFSAAQANFDAAARDGLGATILWPSRRSPSPVPRSLGEVARELVPAAEGALVAAGVEMEDVRPRLELVRRRVETGRTGAAWQRAAVADGEERIGRERAIVRMLREYSERSVEGTPVVEWPMPGPT